MVEPTHETKRRSFTLSASAIPAEIFRMEDPNYIAERMANPVAAGQLWLAKTKIGIQYVLITAVADDPRIVTAVPMDNNTAVRTDDSLIIDHTPLGMPMVAWPKLAADIPMRVLFKPLDEFNAATTAALADDRADDALGISRATAPEDPMLSAEREVYEVRQRMDAWHRQCADLPELHSEEERESMTPDRAKYARALVQVLGLSFDEVNEVLNGQLALSTIQEQQLSEAGIDAKQLRPRTFNLPKGLLIEIEQPLYRSMANEYATHTDTDPRVALAKDAFALAARKNGYGASAWRGAIQQAAQDRTKTAK